MKRLTSLTLPLARAGAALVAGASDAGELALSVCRAALEG